MQIWDLTFVRGESAGGGSVGAHLTAYGGRDDKLFRAAISQSGFPSRIAGAPTVAEWQPIYDYVVSATNCSSAVDSLACLRTVPIADLSAVVNSTFNGINVGTGAGYGPQIDGDFQQMSGTAQLKSGQFVKVPYLVGTNFDEGTSFGTRGVNTTADFIDNILSRTPNMDNATLNTVLELYPDDPAVGIPSTLEGRPSPESGFGTQWKREAAYVGDITEQAPRRFAAESWAKANATAYSYHFDVLVNGATAEQGAGHFREVAFVFADTIGLGYVNAVSVDPFADKPETYKELARAMSQIWAAFIVDLDPNTAEGEFSLSSWSHNPEGCSELSIQPDTNTPLATASSVEWPRYTLDNPENIVFDANVTELAYIEPDTYREDGIRFMIDGLDTVYGQ